MHRIALNVIVIGAALAPGPIVLAAEPLAGDMAKVMHLWCTQAGTWTGMIDVTAADGKRQRQELVTAHDCTEAFHTAYFANARDSPYRFSFVSVEATDDTHWKTIIASAPGTETYEGRPAILRHIRVRDGDKVVSWKDVQFADGKQDFEPRSRIEQTLRR